MKVLIICMFLLVGNTSDKKFNCPTNDGEYVGRNTHPELIPSRRFGSSLFKLNNDLEITSLTSGISRVIKQKGIYNVIIANDSVEVTYFSVYNPYIKNDQEITLGQRVGCMELNSVLSIRILINGKHITPVFSCD